MLTPNRLYPHLSYEGLTEVARFVENDLANDWVIRIEYSSEISYLTTSWEQWGKAFYKTPDASGVIDSIFSCHVKNPLCAIRLHAEKFSPRSRCYFWICQSSAFFDDAMRF